MSATPTPVNHPDTEWSEDAGYSLVELSVVMVIASVLMTAVVSVLIGTTRLSKQELDRVPAQSQTLVGTDVVSRALRAVVVPSGETQGLLSAAPAAVTFYAQLNRPEALLVNGAPVPTKVEFYVSGTCLVRALTPARALVSPSAAGPFYAWDTGRTAQCVARSARAPQLALTYYASATGMTGLTVPTTGLDTSSRATVRSVGISLRLFTSTTSSSTVIDRVTLANLVGQDWR